MTSGELSGSCDAKAESFKVSASLCPQESTRSHDLGLCARSPLGVTYKWMRDNWEGDHKLMQRTSLLIKIRLD